MGSDSFRNLVVAFLLFSLFSVLVVNAVNLMGVNYGVSSEKMEQATGGALDIYEQESDLLGSGESTENFRERFESGDVDDVDDASGVFQVAGDIIGVITAPFNLLARVGDNLLGIPSVVTYTLLGILNLFLILGIWRVLRTGD